MRNTVMTGPIILSKEDSSRLRQNILHPTVEYLQEHRNISFYVAKLQIVACVQHTAVSISTSLAKIILCFLCCCDEHLRSLEMFCKKCLRNLRSEVSKIYTECVTACFFDILQSLDHMDLTLYDTDRTFVDILCIVFLCVSFYKALLCRSH